MVVSCPHCKARLKIDDRLAGKRAACPSCKAALIIPASASAPANDTPSAPKLAAPPGAGPAPGPPPLPDAAAAAGPAATGAAKPAHEAPTPNSRAVPAPPPLPKNTAAKVTAPTGGPPPVPTGPAVKKDMGPPPIPGASGGSVGDSLTFVMSALVRALSVQKIGYSILGGIVFTILFCVPAGILLFLAAKSESLTVVRMVVPIVAVLYTGLIGVLAGGMAHLADADARDRRGSLGSAFGFCARRFVPLFAGTVLFGVVLLVVLFVVNRPIMYLDRSGGAGAVFASLLLLPQFAINMGMAIAYSVVVLVPIAIAADENVGASQAVSRLLQCVRRDTSRLLVHLVTSVLMGVVIVVALGGLVVACLVATLWANGGDPALPMFLVLTLLESDTPTRLRAIGIVLILLILLGYLLAYWAGSFTGYYRDALRRGLGAQPGSAPRARR
jgi:hypothetical protein